MQGSARLSFDGQPGFLHCDLSSASLNFVLIVIKTACNFWESLSLIPWFRDKGFFSKLQHGFNSRKTRLLAACHRAGHGFWQNCLAPQTPGGSRGGPVQLLRDWNAPASVVASVKWVRSHSLQSLRDAIMNSTVWVCKSVQHQERQEFSPTTQLFSHLHGSKKNMSWGWAVGWETQLHTASFVTRNASDLSMRSDTGPGC